MSLSFMRRAFTLIELLAVVAIIAAMTTVGVVSLYAGREAAQVKAAARDVYAAIKNARSRAIVTGNRVIVSFSNTGGEDSRAIKIDVESALVMNTSLDPSQVQPYYITELDRVTEKPSGVSVTSSAELSAKDEGESVEEILFSPMGSEVVEGLCLKFQRGEEESYLTEAQRLSGTSTFSSLAYSERLGAKYSAARGVTNAVSSAERDSAKDDGKERELVTDGPAMEDSGTVVWETNGSVDPHRVWIYPEGQDPATGLVLIVDRFGGIKICSADGSDEEEE